jgi:hypothetical protein
MRQRADPADRVYGLESWPMKTDKSGALVRKYCPELKDFPDKVGAPFARSPLIYPWYGSRLSAAAVMYRFPLADWDTSAIGRVGGLPLRTRMLTDSISTARIKPHPMSNKRPTA